MTQKYKQQKKKRKKLNSIKTERLYVSKDTVKKVYNPKIQPKNGEKYLQIIYLMTFF